MVNDAIDAEFVESGTALAVPDASPKPPSLFGSEDPVEIVERAVRVANALKAVVVSKNLISNIQGKQYPQVEAWLTLAAMLRLTTVCEWSRPVSSGWEARVFVRDATGAIVGAAEAQCLGSERTKKSWEDYALRSMAQTRATSKALRSVLGFVMVLAGYQATPSEEMPDTAPPPPPPPVRNIDAASQPQKKMIFALCNELHFEQADRHKVLEGVTGKRSLNDVTRDEATKVISYLNDLIRDSAPPLEGVT